MRSDLIDLVVELRHETEKAVLVSDGGDAVWFPKSQCEIARSDDGRSHVLTCPRRLAEEKGLL